MGCCLSLRTTDDRLRQSDGGAAPPPTKSPPEEEETVKEVLLETPLPPKSIEKIKQQSNNKVLKVEEIESTAVINANRTPQNENEIKEVIVSEVVSECFSNSPEKNAAGEVNQRLNSKKPLGHGGVRRRAPANAEKRGQVAPLRQRRNVEAAKSCRRDAGESSGRRIRSPEKRDDLRNASETVGENEAVIEIGGEIRAGKGDNDVVLREEEGETLENPVVSLECFIFL